MIVVIPLFVRKINPWVFMLSGAVSLIVIGGYLVLFKRVVPNLFVGHIKQIKGVVLGIFILMNAFYFFNIIPPIPLALRDDGVYKSVVRTDTGYSFMEFQRRFSWKTLKKEYIVEVGSPVFFYSSVFAPVRFEQVIVHEWQKKDAKGDWVTVSAVTFPIIGGSDTGYRGYTVSQRVTPGEWRVLVKTRSGQTLGGETFVVRIIAI
jgi:hypothetical protein